MRKTAFAMAVAAALGMAAPGQGQEAQDLGWLSGQWRAVEEGPAAWTQESWTTPEAGMMMGVNRTVRGSRTVAYEFIRITYDAAGAVYYASPEGQPPVQFRRVDGGGGWIAFANPAHDYPQRIVYRRTGDTLTATISMADGSRAQSWDFRRHPR